MRAPSASLCAAAATALLAAVAPAPAWDTLPSRTADDPSFVYTPSPADWRAINLYQVMTDRFFDGDPANNNARGGFDSWNGDWAHGGDFKGIEAKLGYLEELGVTAIWISPVQFTIDRTSDNAGNQFIPYHGYMPTDLNRINTQFGSLRDLRDLIDAAHARGIYVILDIVVNHLADLISSATTWKNEAYNVFEYDDPVWHRGYAHGAPFDDINRFHHNGAIENYDDPNQYLRGELTGGLDDIRTEDGAVRADLALIFKALISATDCDGFRIDAVKHVEMDFWDSFLPALYAHAATLGKNNFLCFGEVFDGRDDFVGSYTGPTRHNSMLYFPMFETAEDVFVEGQPTSLLTDRTAALTNYDAVARGQLVGFLDNHDEHRILSASKLNGDTWRLKVALAWLYTSHEIPCIYYGTEQGFDGGEEPWNREDMFDGDFEFGPSDGDNFDTTHELFQFIKTLNQLRADYPVLAVGDFIPRWEDHGGRGIYAYTKVSGPDEAVVVLNTHRESRDCFPAALQPEGTRYANLLNPGEEVIVDASRTLPVTAAGHEVKILVPISEPSTVAFQPAAPTGCGDVTIVYNPGEGPLTNAAPVHIFIGHDGWQDVLTPHPAMMPGPSGTWSYVYSPPPGSEEINCVFNDGAGAWDNHNGADWVVPVSGCDPLPVALVEGSPEVGGSGGAPNLPGEAFDLSRAGSYARTQRQGGFGDFGKVFLNYDATNLYIGATGCDLGGTNNAMVLFLGIDTYPDGAAVENLWELAGPPAGLDQLHNVAFGPTGMCVAIVLGDEWGDGTFPAFLLEDGYDFGQGVFYLSRGLNENFAPVPGGRLSQFDGQGAAPTATVNDDGNRQTDRWEATIPWDSLYAAQGVSSVRHLYLAGLITSSSTSGPNRYVSGNYLGAAAGAPEGMDGDNFGFHFVSLTALEVLLPPNPDQDGDGLADAWELGFFSDLAHLAGGADYDQDGATDGEEAAAGTNPTNAASVFECRTHLAGRGVVIRWHSVSGRVYQVWRAGNLAGGEFVLLDAGLPATPNENSFTDTVTGVGAVYQVRTQ